MNKFLVMFLLFLAYTQAENIDEVFNKGHNLYLDRKYIEAIEPLEQACKANINKACIDLYTIYGAMNENKKAFDSIKIACNNADDNACSAMAELYVLGKGVAKDAKKGLDILNKNIQKENSMAMFIMAVLYSDGTEVNKDYSKAINLGLKACDKDEAMACRHIAGMYQSGLGVNTDNKKAFELYKKSCNGKNMSGIDKVGCVNAGVMLEMGTVVNKSTGEALEMYKTACSLGENVGCSNYGTLLYKLQNYKESLSFNIKACYDKIGKACSIVATQYIHGEGVAKSDQSAIRYIKLACQYGDNNACGVIRKFKIR